jgi:hypothetical protein
MMTASGISLLPVKEMPVTVSRRCITAPGSGGKGPSASGKGPVRKTSRSRMGLNQKRPGYAYVYYTWVDPSLRSRLRACPVERGREANFVALCRRRPGYRRWPR